MLVLGSASPRRRELLDQLGIPFESRSADIDETQLAGELPSTYVRRMAREKLEALLDAPRFVLSADTVVVIDDDVLQKPNDPAEGRRMLQRLSGRSHQVLTAVALGQNAVLEVLVATTTVDFRQLTSDEIERYVATGEGADKAGGYAAQGIAGGFISRFDGSYANVVGLPIAEVVTLLRRHHAIGQWP